MWTLFYAYRAALPTLARQAAQYFTHCMTLNLLNERDAERGTDA